MLFYAERLAAPDRVSGLDHPVAADLRRNLRVTASGLFLRHCLESAAALVGTDRLLFSTDYPYRCRPGGDAEAGFAHADRERLAGGGAA